MFLRSAHYYDALYGFKDYGAATTYLRSILDREIPTARRLLDVGCGTGVHLELLRDRYDVEGLDLNPQLLEAARTRNPDVPLHEADMADFRVPGRFDVVTCLFSAIAYVRTRARMRDAIRCMREHLSPGGIIVLEPWFEPDEYWTGTITANHVEQPDLKIAWMYTSEREQDISVLDIHYMVGSPSGIARFEERHELGLWTRDEHLEAFRDVGLEPRFDPDAPFGRGLYVARDPAAASTPR